MAKKTYKKDEVPLPPLGAANTAEWQQTPEQVLNGQAYIDHADQVASAMEEKWGVGRLRLLVTPELTAAFDRQVYRFNHAIRHGTLEEVKAQAVRMARGWNRLDADAVERDCWPIAAEVWEVALEDGTVAAVVRSDAEASSVLRSGRATNVYTMAEIGRMIDGYPALVKIKEEYPGATVAGVRKPGNPLDAMPEPDDDIPF